MKTKKLIAVGVAYLGVATTLNLLLAALMAKVFRMRFWDAVALSAMLDLCGLKAAKEMEKLVAQMKSGTAPDYLIDWLRR